MDEKTIFSKYKQLRHMKHFIIISTLIILSGCSGKTTQNEAAGETQLPNQLVLTDAQMHSAEIKLGKIEQKSISSIIKVNGKIDVPPQNMVSVSMPLGGYLKSTKLLPGMHVGKGEVIASMEDLQYIQLQQEYLTAKSKLQFAEAEYVRQKDLNQSKASSDKVFQQAQMDYSTQKVLVSALTEKLKLINIDPKELTETSLSKAVNIYSPIDGFVTRVNVNIGKYVNPSDILFELVNPTDIHLNLKVFEKDLEKLFIGQKVLAFNNNQPDKKHPCEIILISRDISAERTAEVHCHFEDYDKTLLPGMYMNGEIEVQVKNAGVIKENAIVSFDNKDFIFVSKGNNTFEMVEIIKGISENNFTEITFATGKLNEKEQIVVHGAYSLLMQLKNKTEE